MNRKMFFLIGITSIAFLCNSSLSSAFLEEKNIAGSALWLSHSLSDFRPQWDLIPSTQDTYNLFANSLVIPGDAVRNEADASIVFNMGDEKITLFANGIKRTDGSDGAITFFDKSSSAQCIVTSFGAVQASHLDKAQMNSCSVSVEDGELVFKSVKILSVDKQRLNLLVRLRDGFSIVFEYLDDGTIIAHESTGAVEIISRVELVLSDIFKSHGMIRPPQEALCVPEGMVCRDGDGVTCYVMDGMRFHVAVNGLKLSFLAPAFQAQLEGLVSGDRLLTRWKFGPGLVKPYKKCRFDGVDILFDADSGRALLYANFATMQSGVFLYDSNGNYCKCSGVGGLRYGKVSSMLTYDGVTLAVAHKSHAISRDFSPKFLHA